MRFFKDNSYDIVKLFINQIGIAIFSLMLYSTVSLIDSIEDFTTIYVFISVFSMLFYFALLYTAAWDFGAKDKIRIDSGRAKATPMKGALMSVYANIPNFLLTGLAIIFKILHFVGAGEGFHSAFALLNSFFRFIMSVYLGLIKGIFSGLDDEIGFFVQAIAFFVIPVLAIAVTQLGYFLGSKEKRIRDLFSPKTNDE